LIPSFTGSEPFLIGPDVWSQAVTPGHLRTSVTTTSVNFPTASTPHWVTLYSDFWRILPVAAMAVNH
jgi:hypothetical protein